jgi:3D (Asp-Asp-Asp) domain-containing protein
MSCRKLSKFLMLALTVTALYSLMTALPLLAQCQARIATVPVPGSIADAGATCVTAALVDLGNGTVVDRANHLLWDKEVVSLGGNVSDYEAYCSLVMNAILTQAHLLLKLTDYVSPVSGVLLALRSDRPTLDQFVGPTRNTGVDGSADAYVQTRDQTSKSTIDSTTSLLWTDPKGVVTWLPARYVTPFYTTCYRTDLESDFTGPFIAATKWSWCNTTPTGRAYRAAFMKDIQTQGSGVSVLNETIQYLTSGNCYYMASCPTTSTGVCATVGVTVAVDNKVSPVISMGAAIDIDTLGARMAQDTGSRKSLVGYHIDVYNGLGDAACNGWSNPNLGVTFLHY